MLKDVCFTDGSFDNGDPNTTNLYLGNLNPKVKTLFYCFHIRVCCLHHVSSDSYKGISVLFIIDHRTATDGNIW